MQILGYIEAYGFLILYTLIFVGIPALIFGDKFSKYRLCIRIPMYLTISNIYVIFLVQLLQILHISYGPVIWIINIGLAMWGLIKIRGFRPFAIVQQAYYRFQVIASGAVGVKTLILKVFRAIGRGFYRIYQWIKRYLLLNPVELITLIAVAVMLVIIFGNDCATIYGWRAYDAPVHAWWIGDMISNKIFTDGIYPFGYHCVVYLFYAMFGIPVFITIRCIGFVSVVYMCITIYAALKAICKGAASPAISVLLYFMWNIFSYLGVRRFRYGIPQEYGMIFLLPCLMFFCEFMRLQAAYPKEKGQWKKWDEAKLMALFMGASVSLTFSVHFYNTIAAVIMLVGAAIAGYLFRLFKTRYLVPLVISGFLGLFVAILPMGVCFVTGTPLQGSLNWALGVMGVGEGVDEWHDEIVDPNADFSDKADTSYEQYDRAGELAYGDILIQDNNLTLVGADAAGDAVDEVDATGTTDIADAEHVFNEENPLTFNNFINAIKLNMAYTLFYYSDYREVTELTWFLLICCVIPFVCGLIILIQDKERGLAFMAYSGAAVFMFMEFALCLTGLLSIMDAERSMCFFYPILFSSMALSVDGAVQVVLGWFKKKWLMAIASLAILIGIGVAIYDRGVYRIGPIESQHFEPNGAMACTTNIIATNDNNTWTIISAGDELHMVNHYGFHAEIIEFLYIINKVNHYSKYAIPTEKVYFYIEKNPLNTDGETVSKAYAKEPLPNTLGQTAYFGHNRTVVMSKMFYWAQEFKRKYPNEMYVYYEDDDFICYCLEQNPYSTLNLSMYYGFNENTDLDTSAIVLGEDGKWDESDVTHLYQDILKQQ